MKKRLLVLIDFSPYSKVQLILANNWSKSMDAVLLLVHVPIILKPALTAPETEKEIAEIEKQKSLIKLKEFAQETLGVFQNIDFLVSEQNLLLLIPQLLAQGYDDLIFAGLKGTGTLKKIFWGSTTVDLVNYINHPLVAVPKNFVSLSPGTFYVGINHKYPLNTIQLNYIIKFFKDQVKKLVFITIINEQDDPLKGEAYLKSLVETYNENISSSYEIFNGNDAFQQIKKFMAEQSESILVVQRGSRTLIDQIFRKFLINDLVYDGNVPLIVLPA